MTFFIALAAAWFLTPAVAALAHKLGALDFPDERKVHQRPIPRLGGLAIWAAIILALLASFSYRYFFSSDFGLNLTSELFGIFIGSLIMLAVGVIDDIFSLTPVFKFSSQIIAALVLVAFGMKMEFLGNPFGGSGSLFYLGNIGILLTVFWVVAFCNIINFIDGLDGLAAGVSAIAALAFFAFAWQTGQTSTALISLAIAGATLGFLRHNFHPAKIFMGDSGSLFLGFVFGALTVDGVMKSVAAVALFAPLIIMGVPILDATLAILRRYLNRQPVTQADRDHLHHRLLRRGLSHRQAVIFIYIWSAVLSAVGLIFKFLPASQKYLIIFGGLFITFLFAELVGIFDREN
jgi:UDP-GlcNAc:undecaprenyl-phosphate GlcNAc-1-phosphate transferase